MAMSYFQYIYYKFLASLIRAAIVPIAYLVGTLNAYPDEVRYIPSRDKGRTIKVHVYRSSNAGPSPVLINFHGSGFMIPLHGSDDDYCRTISSQTKYDVIDVRYRLAPENPFPAALNDAEDAVKYVLGRPDEYDLSHISISGFSAGGNLALSTSANLFPPGTFRSVLCIYPPTDLSVPVDEKTAPDPNGRPLPKPVMQIFSRSYVPGLDKKDPRISPALAPLERFPSRVLMITASADSLCLEAEQLAERLQELPASHVVCQRMENCSHAWDKNPIGGPVQRAATKRAYGLAVEMLNE